MFTNKRPFSQAERETNLPADYTADHEDVVPETATDCNLTPEATIDEESPLDLSAFHQVEPITEDDGITSHAETEGSRLSHLLRTHMASQPEDCAEAQDFVAHEEAPSFLTQRKVYGDSSRLEQIASRSGGAFADFAASINSLETTRSIDMPEGLSDIEDRTEHEITKIVRKMEEDERPDEEILSVVADRMNEPVPSADDEENFDSPASDEEPAVYAVYEEGIYENSHMDAVLATELKPEAATGAEEADVHNGVNALIRGTLLPRISIPLAQAGSLEDVTLHIQRTHPVRAAA